MARPQKRGDRYRIRWIDERGQRRSETFATRKEAEFWQKRHQIEAEEIKRGWRHGIAPDKTFGELFDYWLEKRAPRKRTRRDMKYIIEKDLRPAFGERLLRELSVEHVDDYIGAHDHLSPKTVANHLTLLISMLHAAKDLRWIREVPAIKKPRVVPLSTDFRYLRTGEEITRFLNAAKDAGENVYALYATAIYTGMRAGELAGLRADDIDFGRRLITVQRSFDGPTKSGAIRHVPILDPLLPVLRRWRLSHPGTLVFTSEAGTMLSDGGRVFQETLHRVLANAGFGNVKVGKREASYITFHGLRHTFASHWVLNGGDLFRLQKILGHTTVAMTMRYAHLAPDAFAGDYARLGRVAPGEPAKIVDIAPN